MLEGASFEVEDRAVEGIEREGEFFAEALCFSSVIEIGDVGAVACAVVGLEAVTV
jgi:hypothetical protein